MANLQQQAETVKQFDEVLESHRDRILEMLSEGGVLYTVKESELDVKLMDILLSFRDEARKHYEKILFNNELTARITSVEYNLKKTVHETMENLIRVVGLRVDNHLTNNISLDKIFAPILEKMDARIEQAENLYNRIGEKVAILKKNQKRVKKISLLDSIPDDLKEILIKEVKAMKE